MAFLCGTSLAAGEVPADYTAAIGRAEWLGTALYVHDSAAARATDELIQRGVLEKDERIQGRITAMTENSNSVLVTFVGEQDGTPHALYRVSVPPGNRTPVYEALTPALPLSSSEGASYAARTLALAELTKDKERCGEGYNTVVLPIQRQGDRFILVYVLAATNQPSVVVAGGHIRYEVSPDGEENRRTEIVHQVLHAHSAGKRQQGERSCGNDADALARPDAHRGPCVHEPAVLRNRFSSALLRMI